MTPPGVMHLVDALDAGGAERVAVNLVNLLARKGYPAHLCTTRRDGVLDALVDPGVERLRLARRSTIDLGALAALSAYNRRHRVAILHAHQTSLFLATAASFLPPYPRVVWHDHFGRHGVEERPTWLYRTVARRASVVISVSRPLADWATSQLGLSPDRVRYVPNFVCNPAPGRVPDLPGTPGSRLVAVANFRPQKDHLTLLRAMRQVAAAAPEAHLLLIGEDADPPHAARVRAMVAELGLNRSVSLLGARQDVAAVLRGADIGILSSASEGLPLALLEYGYAALPVVATSVGECAEVLEHGKAGVLVPPGNPDALADAILGLLADPVRRTRLAEELHRHVTRAFSAEAGLAAVIDIYDMLVASHGKRSQAAAV